MTNYKYDTATGPVEIEVDERWASLLKEEDADERNSERRHIRPDHKYAPGEPLSLDGARYEGEWLEDRRDEIEAAALSVDLERALRSLTELQRRYFILSRIEGYSYAEIAKADGKQTSTVLRLVEAAAKKLKKYF
jgi:RNA polymerase sigma factor (sigma-70 family)